VEHWSGLARLPREKQPLAALVVRKNAESYRCLQQGRLAVAEKHAREALALSARSLGEDHPETFRSLGRLGDCLNRLGRSKEALLLHRRCLETCLALWGEEHRDVAGACNNVASSLHALGRHAEALPLLRKAMRIFRKTLGEEQPHTAGSYNNLAVCLRGLGRHGEALPLFRKALAINRKARGDDHPATATSCNNLAACLDGLGLRREALPFHLEAFRISRKTHKDPSGAALSCGNLASCLNAQGKSAEALRLYGESLRLSLESRGENHPQTASGYNNLAFCLAGRGQHARALVLHRKALAINRAVFGEEHTRTATSHHNVASCLDEMGRRAEAVRHYRLALVGLDVARQSAASPGLDRSQFAAFQVPARPLLAALLAREGKPAEAWRQAESHFARGLLDALDSGPSGEETTRRQELTRLERAIVPLACAVKLSGEEERSLASLARRRRRLLAETAHAAAARLDALVWSHREVQRRLPADAGLLFWLDAGKEHWGCCLRREGEPHWVRLPGGGGKGEWTAEDAALPGRVRRAAREAGSNATLHELTRRLHRQRLEPLEKHLKAQGKRPPVRRLIVVPAGAMAGVPAELLAPDRTVSYAPSATLFARAADRRRPARLTPLVALGDPVFDRENRTPPPAPGHGLLLAVVLPGGAASRAGLRAGDILLAYDGARLRSLPDLRPVEGARTVKGLVWRDGEVFPVRLQPGPLLARIDPRPVARALAAWRREEELIRGPGERFLRLPGTRLEAAAVARLVGEDKATLLLGSAASEQKLDRLIRSGALRKARLIHLATHGRIHPLLPEHSALVLARDRLPDPLEQARAGRKVYDGYLRVRAILEGWDLDADLVVLSACQTGLGKDGHGEGFLGFVQALLQKGARGVMASLWKVDDTATALLMLRFYENLLGRRDGLKKPLGRAEALSEAKRWLAQLGRDDALALSGGLVTGEVRGTVKKLKKPTGKPDERVKVPGGERPFAHPAYWAAFVLVGEAD
jgi:tetratricopeptide (TPR) repeat protein